MRKVYLDNIRWATVLLVMVYHVFYMFNASGVMGGVGSFHEVQYQDALLCFVYPWFMVLLFLIAGMSACYGLGKMSDKEFLKRRTWKLLVPSTLGLFVYQWIVGYYNIKAAGQLENIPSFIVYPVSVLSGVGPMWFAQTLWLFSLLLLLIRRMDGKNVLRRLGGKCNFAVLILFAFVLWGGAQVLNMPVVTTYRFGIYLTAFLLGYFVFSHEEVQEKLEKMRLPLLIVSVCMGTAYVSRYFGQNYADTVLLKSLFTNGYAWLAVLAILGCGRKWFTAQNRFSAYMVKASYGFYVLHYTAVLIPCYYLKNNTTLPAWAVYTAALLTAFAGTFLLYEIISRLPVIRCLVLGIRRKAGNNDKR